MPAIFHDSLENPYNLLFLCRDFSLHGVMREELHDLYGNPIVLPEKRVLTFLLPNGVPLIYCREVDFADSTLELEGDLWRVERLIIKELLNGVGCMTGDESLSKYGVELRPKRTLRGGELYPGVELTCSARRPFYIQAREMLQGKGSSNLDFTVTSIELALFRRSLDTCEETFDRAFEQLGLTPSSVHYVESFTAYFHQDKIDDIKTRLQIEGML
ncbi:MAG TPA: hypothetical protein VJJ21_03395 [Candidatus Nanoarchaeia archaeon]|nr:hypothetical protein [Candidatus Nanoarchaeia archaeon]